MKIRYPLALLLALLSACQQDEPSSQAKGLSEGFSRTLDEVQRMVDQYTPPRERIVAETERATAAAGGELEKLFNWEYHVASLDTDAEPEVVQRELSKLGKERWECFAATTQFNSIQILCKRRPKTYLRYLEHLPGLLP